MVLHRGRKIEVTTFRSDASYSDGRHPDAVTFSGPREDAMRRDFTINGMFYDPIAEELIDYVGGRADLQAGVVRTIGEPDMRFAEDYLRMLRAVRFAVRFEFSIEPATAEAVRRLAPNITHISGERIFDELGKMLARDSAPAALAKLDELKLAREILPRLAADRQLWSDATARGDAVAARRDLWLTLAALLMDLEPDHIGELVRGWGASNDLRDAMMRIARRRDDWKHAADWSLAAFKRLMASDQYERLRILWRVRERQQTGRDSQSRRIASRAGSIAPESVDPPPLIDGGDLKTLGLRQGPQIGRVLKQVRDTQLNEHITTRREALAMARRLIEGG
jgi:poly(A) polymerase